MSTILTNSGVILTLDIIALLGFTFLGIFTLRSYASIKNRLILFISLAYFTITISILLEFLVLPQAGTLGIDEEYLEAMIEGIQFIAAFFFFYGLKIVKTKKQEVVSQ